MKADFFKTRKRFDFFPHPYDIGNGMTTFWFFPTFDGSLTAPYDYLLLRRIAQLFNCALNRKNQSLIAYHQKWGRTTFSVIYSRNQDM